MLIRILKSYGYPDLLRQTPGNRGKWNDIEFIVGQDGPCDYAVVHGSVAAPAQVSCPASRIWGVMTEPPNEIFGNRNEAVTAFHTVYTQNTFLAGSRYVHTHGALPWHVNRSYDELVKTNIPYKDRDLSFITSRAKSFAGHNARLRFLDLIQPKVEFDLYGRGFNPVDDKWDALAPYKYALVVENFQNPHYWTEKIADCFLAWTMPIYSGCTGILDYFPAESLIMIDIQDPDSSIEKIKEAVDSDAWIRNREAIEHSRNLILNKYQLFPYISDLVKRDQEVQYSQTGQELSTVILPPKQMSPSLKSRIAGHISKRYPRSFAFIRSLIK